MILFSISMNRPAEEGCKLMNLLRQSLEHTLAPAADPGLEWHTAFLDRRTEITCEVKNMHDQALIQQLIAATGTAISSYIVSEQELALLERMLRREFAVDDREIPAIVEYCKKLLNGGTGAFYQDKWTERSEKVAEIVSRYLETEVSFNLDGFVRFRLQGYLDELREVATCALDEFIMDKQYKEFISLLRQFVRVQESKVPVAHLIHKGDYEFSLLDEFLQPIETKSMEGLILEMPDEDLNYEDMIVSTLITISPQQIYIHTPEADMQVIKTIKQIFESRAVICQYCDMCHTVLH